MSCEIKVYLCYEENRNQLFLECGAVDELKSFGSIDKTV